MTPHLGQMIVRGSLEHYARFFDLLEVSADAERLPRSAVLRRWRAAVPVGFAFSVALPSPVAALATAEPTALDGFWRAVDVLEPSWLVIRTPRTVTPTSRHRDGLAELVGRVKPKGVRIAWRAEGLWEPDDALRLAAALDICWVADVGREDLPPRENIYATLRSLGSGGVVGAGMVERAAERLIEREDACVILEGRGAGRAAAMMRQVLGELGADCSLDLEGECEEAEGEL